MSELPPLVLINQQLKSMLGTLIDAKEFRILSTRKVGEGWQADVEAFVRDPRLSIRNAAGEKDIVKRSRFRFEFDANLQMVGFAETETELS